MEGGTEGDPKRKKECKAATGRQEGEGEEWKKE